jgi:hypothetical protein
VVPGDPRREAIVLALGAWHLLRGGRAAWDLAFAFGLLRPQLVVELARLAEPHDAAVGRQRERVARAVGAVPGEHLQVGAKGDVTPARLRSTRDQEGRVSWSFGRSRHGRSSRLGVSAGPTD